MRDLFSFLFSSLVLIVVSVVVVIGAAVACAGTPTPPPCRPAAVAWTPASGAVATRGAPPSTSASAPPTTSKYPIDQLLKARRAFAARALDAKSFLYLYDLSGTPQIFRSPSFTVDGAGRPHETPAMQLTDFPDRVSSLRVAPDAKRVVFMKDAGGDENDQIWRLDLAPSGDAKATPLTATPKAKHTLPTFDDAGTRVAFTSNARNGKDMDLWLRAWPGGEAKPDPFVALSGSFQVTDWRGDAILLVESRSSVDQDLWLVDARTRAKKLLTRHTGDERWQAGRFSRDGRAVFALSDAGREFVALVALDVATGKRTTVVAQDHDVVSFSTPHWRVGKKAAAGDDLVVFATNVGGVDEVSTVTLDAARREVKRTTTGPKGVVGTLDVSPDGDVAVVALESARLPAEIHKVEIESGKVTRETFSDHAGIDEGDLVDVERGSFKSFDGTPISYFLYAGKGAGAAQAAEKLPVVIAVHGGPEAQAQPGFSAVAQYLALSGYSVAFPNVRGSTGYGKRFEHLDDREKREDSVRDLSEFGKHLAARPDLDGRRIALYGGSYGGYMVLAGLTLYPDQWAAGVDIVGIANFRTFLQQTAPYRRALREAEYGSLARDGALLDRISPLHRVDRIKAPLMVIHGTRDPRVPVGETVQITEALKKRGLPVQLLTFDDEGHGLSKLKNRLVAYPAVVAFLDQYVKNARK